MVGECTPYSKRSEPKVGRHFTPLRDKFLLVAFLITKLTFTNMDHSMNNMQVIAWEDVDS
jgi:formate/nitrite transporter FocA (FNT family)